MQIKQIYCLQNQTLLDIAVQEYGSVEGVILLLQANPGLGITDTLLPGQELVVWTDEAVKTMEEAIKTEPYASQLQSLLTQWAKLIKPYYAALPALPTQPFVTIPSLQIKTIAGMLEVLWSGDPSFLAYQPTLRLFRYTKQSRWLHVDGRPERKKTIRWRKTRSENEPPRPTIFTFPLTPGVFSPVSVNIDHWVISIPDGIRICRGSWRRLEINADALTGSRIFAKYGLAIVINNPVAGALPKTINGPIAQFRMGASMALINESKTLIKWIKSI